MASNRFWDKAPHRKIPPSPLHEFKELPPNVPINLPEHSKNRKRTDFACFIIFVIFLLILLGLTIYIWATTDMTHLSFDKDICGNVCGHKNDDKDLPETCEPKDYTNASIAEYELEGLYSKVVIGCTSAEECKAKEKLVVFRQCIEKAYVADVFDLMVDGVSKSAVGIAVGTIHAICAMLVFYLCLKWNTATTFTVILAIQMILLAVFVAVTWFLFVRYNYHLGVLAAALVLTILLILGLLLLYLLRKLYKLVIAIYEEATECIFNTKMILLVPVIMALLVLGLFVFVYWMLVLLVSMDTELNALQIIYCVLLVCVALWLFLFMIGCNVMIIAGVTARHYFTKDKKAITSPLSSSIGIMAFYHVGTIALGSFVMTLIKIIQIIMELVRSAMEKEDNLIIYCICLCISCCCTSIEVIIDYLTRKAYIITAIHGKGLLASGMRGARLIWCFLLDIIYVDVLGYTVMGFVEILAIIISCVIASLITMKYFAQETLHVATICCVLTFCIASGIVYFYGLLMNVSAETIFLCYCEDKLLNDGSMARPYFMSKRLLDVLNTCVEVGLNEKEKERQERDQNS